MSALCRIELLGWLRVEREDRVISRFQTRQTGALLAYLAYHPHRSHSREVLAEILWPENEPETARHKLRVALSSLRRQCEPPGLPRGAVIIADRTSVQLSPAALTTDVAEFASALQSAERSGSSSERTHFLTKAVELYRGELLPGHYEDWVSPERERLAEAYFQALRQLIRQLKQSGDFPRALDYTRRAVGAAPLREEAHRDLMRLLAASDQPAAAMHQYRELEQILKTDLDTTPSEATRGLAQAIRCRMPVARERPTVSPDPPDATPGIQHPKPDTPPSPFPSGTVTFLWADVDGAEKTEEEAETGQAEVPASSEILLRELRQHGGHVVTEERGFILLAFDRPSDAVACAVAGQRSWLRAFGADEAKEPAGKCASSASPTPRGPRPTSLTSPRMALHTGEVTIAAGQYGGAPGDHTLLAALAAHRGQLLCTGATAALLRRPPEPGGSDYTLHDLGDYLLRDAASGSAMPERLFQISAADAPQREFPPLKAPRLHPSNLPIQFTRFVGREEELDRLKVWLLPGEAGSAPGSPLPPPLVTLTGPGGCGKTRLALEMAGRLLASFRGAVWSVPLTDLSDARRIPDAIRDALGLPSRIDAEPWEQVVEALSHPPALLVLDNLEHLVTEGAPIVRTLQERVPTLTCLVTSRCRLNLTGERELPVSPLPMPEQAAPPERLVLCPSVQLFVDRAQAARPDFQVTAENASAVAELCRRLEGIPLALELAAARASVLTPAQMLPQLECRFDFLVSRKRNAASRHRTLRAAIDWSYQLLALELQQFFARLSVFRGGFTLEAASAICGFGFRTLGPGLEEEPLVIQNPKSETQNPEVPDYLASLRECSLVMVEEVGDELRYRLLETLREYSYQELESQDEAVATLRRHAEFFTALAEEAGSRLTGSEQNVWLERLEREHDNLRAALGWALERDLKTGLRLACAMECFWSIRGYWTEGREWLERHLAKGSEGAPDLRARALLAASRMAQRQSDCKRAAQLAEESLRLYRQQDNPHATADALHALGRAELSQGDMERGRALCEESLAIRRDLDDRSGIADLLHSLGSLAVRRRDYVHGRACFAESLEIRRESGDRRNSAVALFGLGSAALEQGDDTDAQAFYEEGLALATELGDKSSIAWAVQCLGLIALLRGDCPRARGLFEESLTLRRALDDKRGMTHALFGLARVARAAGDATMARSLMEEALAIRTSLGDRAEGAGLSLYLGNVALAQGNLTRANLFYKESLLLARELDAPASLSQGLEGLARVACGQGEAERAARLYGAAEAQRTIAVLPAPDRKADDEDSSVSVTRAALGEEAFAAAWAEGRSLTPEQAVVYALNEPASVARP